MTFTAQQQPSARSQQPGRKRKATRRTSLFTHGEPMVWLTGGSLAFSLAMIVGLLALIVVQGSQTFWPVRLLEVRTHDGRAYMGEVMRREAFRPNETQLEGLSELDREAAERALAGGEEVEVERTLLRTGNYELTGVHSLWISGYSVAEEGWPEWGLVVERYARGRFYGFPTAFELDGERIAETPAEVWQRFGEHHDDVAGRRSRIEDIEKHDIGRINRRIRDARLGLKVVQQSHGEGSPEAIAQEADHDRVVADAQAAYEEVRTRIDELRAENERYQLVLTTADGIETRMGLAEVMRAYPANQLSYGQRWGVYLARAWQFVSDSPRHMNLEGGVFPAIFGTVVMTLIMCIMVVPFGVLAALYLREYAKQGFLVSAVRIAVNNLAGVPSIVFGVFGLGFFCYLMGARIDELLFSAELPNPTYGKGGVLWASLTLALLTLPVVIVATEESLAAVPGSMREGSYACGATKWQTIRRIVLPRAMPGIMTGTVLAIARGAGEVAPLMLVGVMAVAPELPIDGVWPFIHPERSFMHLGYHIFDLGFQSPDSEAAKPMVFTTTLLLIGIVILLNVFAITVRSRLRRKFVTG